MMDPPGPGMKPACYVGFVSTRPLILFDGVCNLCHGSVRWVLARDKRARFEFASLQSQVAAKALEGAWPEETPPDSIVLIVGDQILIRSDAAIEVGVQLGFPWCLGVTFKILPRRLRDAIYKWVARNRYRWFGQRDSCSLPSPGEAERFLDAGEHPMESLRKN